MADNPLGEAVVVAAYRDLVADRPVADRQVVAVQVGRQVDKLVAAVQADSQVAAVLVVLHQDKDTVAAVHNYTDMEVGCTHVAYTDKVDTDKVDKSDKPDYYICIYACAFHDGAHCGCYRCCHCCHCCHCRCCCRCPPGHGQPRSIRGAEPIAYSLHERTIQMKLLNTQIELNLQLEI